MRNRPYVLAALLPLAFALAACGGEAGQASPAVAPTTAGSESALPPAITAFTKAAESGNVDKVGTVDGQFVPDGTPDLAFDVTLQGTVKALFVITVDRQGNPNKKYRADTLIKDQEAPEELGGMLEQGSFSGGIGVYENGHLVNGGDGSLPVMKPGPHSMRLYVNRVESLGAGGHVRVYATTADGKVIAGPTVDY